VVKHYNKTHQNQQLSAKSKTSREVSFIQNGNQVGLFLRW
jgi:hypothetical protein